MKISTVVFGKNGQVGSNLVRIFTKKKRFDTRYYSSKDVDFLNLDSLAKFLEGQSTKPDFIINCAAYTNVDGAEGEKELADLINHKAVEIIANYCAKNNVKLVHYSTDYVFDGSGNEPFEADNTKNLNPLNHYGKSKLDGEGAIINSGCEYLILRISWIWDKNPRFKNFFNTIKKLAKEREVLTIVDDQIGSPTSAEFVARNTIEIIKNDNFSKEISHLNNGEFMSWYDFALQIVGDLRKEGEDLLVKEIKPIKTADFKTKAIRPLNSRLKNSQYTMNIPKASILMSSYNHEKFIAKAIESVVGQSFEDWELLIMDDCSTDRTFEIAEGFAEIDDRIKITKSPYNRGMVQNTNELITQARGEYIAIINSDDSWEKEKIAKQVDFLDQNQNYGACFTASNAIDDNGKILFRKKNQFPALKKNRHEWLNYFFYHGNCLCYPSSLIRKSCYEKAGLFNPAFICLLDLDMWIRICLAGYEIEILDEKLTNFRILDGQSNLSAPNKGTLVRLTLENQRIIHNYRIIPDYQEFKKVFPQYESKNIDHETKYYLSSLVIDSFFSEKKIPNSKNIQNFGLNFLQEEISNDPNFIVNLQKYFDFTFKKYLQITALYPSGICFADKKKRNIFKLIKRIFS